jgi:NADH:ubiquinone oxidoreductase subunit 5 (subunit L)/multisubunit Na+/H+ antiporter MnhA subunit
MVTAGVFGVFVVLDLFFWFLLYEVALLPMYLLIAVWGSTRKEYGAMKLMMMLLAGSIFIFGVIFALFTHVGAAPSTWIVLMDAEKSRELPADLLPAGRSSAAARWARSSPSTPGRPTATPPLPPPCPCSTPAC